MCRKREGGNQWVDLRGPLSISEISLLTHTEFSSAWMGNPEKEAGLLDGGTTPNLATIVSVSSKMLCSVVFRHSKGRNLNY